MHEAEFSENIGDFMCLTKIYLFLIFLKSDVLNCYLRLFAWHNFATELQIGGKQ